MIFSTDLCPLCGSKLLVLGGNDRAYFCSTTDLVDGHGMGSAHHYYMYLQTKWIVEHSEILVPPFMTYHYKADNKTVIYRLESEQRRVLFWEGPLREIKNYGILNTFY